MIGRLGQIAHAAITFMAADLLALEARIDRIDFALVAEVAHAHQHLAGKATQIVGRSDQGNAGRVKEFFQIGLGYSGHGIHEGFFSCAFFCVFFVCSCIYWCNASTC